MQSKIAGIVQAPMFEYLILNVLNAWAVDEENGNLIWNSPVYVQLANIQNKTMQGIDLIKKIDHAPQSKGWAVTSMMARGISLARLSCLSLAFGSYSDAISNYRMLLEREMTIRYLETNNQYEAFAKAFYAERYHQAGKHLNDDSTRKNFSRSELENHKEIMDLIKTKYFDNMSPKLPGAYWKRPTSEKLVDNYSEELFSKSSEAMHKEVLRIYNLGNQGVHPQLRDMLQPEDTDIAPEDLLGLILVTVGGISGFGLSLFEESSSLADEIEQIILQPPSSTSILDMMT